ncbi:MAG: TetR/AcrR family transcriptional regulator [Rhodobacteraceae bacterium]|nr:TetR/AcrR family transcriptional regulator [Paracoccaceae bacterium]MCW9044056.1 TetR/AcrR family transcriptional regulator [Pseudopelagicola sp.]
MVATRLSPDSWIHAGFTALVAQGSSALKAEALARDLKTTKGSFYWHFKDVPAFHQAMLRHWEDASLHMLDVALHDDGTPVQRLRHFAQSAPTAQNGLASHGTALEPAIRAWAHENPTAAAVVARVDARRMEALDHLLTEMGLSNPELSRILYGARLGMAEMSGRDGIDNENALGTLVDLILALYG